MYMNSFPVFFCFYIKALFPLALPRWFIVISCHRSWKKKITKFTSGLHTYIQVITPRRKTETKSYFFSAVFLPKVILEKGRKATAVRLCFNTHITWKAQYTNPIWLKEWTRLHPKPIRTSERQNKDWRVEAASEGRAGVQAGPPLSLP